MAESEQAVFFPFEVVGAIVVAMKAKQQFFWVLFITFRQTSTPCYGNQVRSRGTHTIGFGGFGAISLRADGPARPV